MKKMTQKTKSFINRLTSMGGRVFILTLALALLGGGLFVAQAVENSDGYSTAAEEYCINVTPSGKKNACMDGWDDAQPCSNLNEMTFDPTIAASDLVKSCEAARADELTCTKAKSEGRTVNKNTLKLSGSPGCPASMSPTDQEKDECTVSVTTTTPQSTTTTTSTTKPNSEGECDPDVLQKEIDRLCEQLDDEDASEEVKNICKFKDDEEDDDEDSGSSGGGGGSQSASEKKKDLEALEKAAEPAKPDNQYGQYVNGANEYAALKVNRAPGDNNAAFVLIHGGGWTSDDGAADKFAPKANERGYTTFVVDYRLGHNGIYYQLDDTLRAIKHVKDNAGMYGVDPNKIGVWGDSAGGSLAIRAAATGKSGAKAAVGWSAPTNAYTAIFHSPESFAVGMMHSTCAPTDVAGFESFQDQLEGGEGIDPRTGFGQGDEDESTDTITTALRLAEMAQETGQSAEEITESAKRSEGDDSESESESGGDSESGDATANIRRFAAKKFLECIDNFNSASPALFASAQSPPMFLAGYDTDPVVHPGQAYQMRDKLRSLGIPSEALILPGVPGPLQPGENHLDYHDKFVAPTLDFTDKFLFPKKADASSGEGASAPAQGTASTQAQTQGQQGTTSQTVQSTDSGRELVLTRPSVRPSNPECTGGLVTNSSGGCSLRPGVMPENDNVIIEAPYIEPEDDDGCQTSWYQDCHAGI